MVESPLDRNPYYQSREWLNISGPHRSDLDLPYDRCQDDCDSMNNRVIITKKEGISKRGACGRPMRLVFWGGKIEDCKNRNAAARALGVSGKTMETWFRSGPPMHRKKNTWPESLMCFRYL
jgi:hypothetical protein